MLLGYNEDEAKFYNVTEGKRSADADVKLWPKVNGKLHIPFVVSHKCEYEWRRHQATSDIRIRLYVNSPFFRVILFVQNESFLHNKNTIVSDAMHLLLQE